MSNRFKAHLEILPAAQRQIWPQLRAITDLGFTLYGGTAIALRLGHRQSVDFDFFSAAPLNQDALLSVLPALSLATTLQEKNNTWVVLTASENLQIPPIKLSFFGGIHFGRVGEPELTEDGVLLVASLDDLLAIKLEVILQRAEAKDYCDIAALLRAGANLAHGLGGARQLFGANFQPSESLKALSYFADGDLPSLNLSDRSLLISAAGAVTEIPTAAQRSSSLN